MVAKSRLFLIAFVVIIMTSILAVFAFNAFATVQPGNPSLGLSVVNYAPDEALKGSVNIGLTSESASSLVEAAIYKGAWEYAYKGMSLLDFLKASGASFSCEPAGCGYSTTSGLIESTALLAGENFVIVNITSAGQGSTSIEDIFFNLTGTSSIGYSPKQNFPYSPVTVDLLDDGPVEWQYMEPGGFPDILEPGDCYSESQYNSTRVDAIIEFNKLYCERKYLLPSKRFMLHADVKFKGDGGAPAPGDLSLYLSDSGYTNYASCDLDQISATEYDLYGCSVNFTLMRPAELFVCILNKGTVDYYIKMEMIDSCGFAGEPELGKPFTADYALYAKPANFTPFNYSIKLDGSSFQTESLSAYLNDYIEKKYGSDCSKGCVMPIKIISSESLTLSALELKYVAGGTALSKKNFYVAEPAKITISQSAVNLKGLGLKAPDEYGDYTLKLKISGIDIGSAAFSVKPALLIPIISSVEPRNVSLNALTKFIVTASSPKGNKIISYTWNFGDGTPAIVTAANNASHTYESSGVYSLIIRAKDNESLEAEGTFIISVGVLSPKEALNATLRAKKAALSSIQSKIKGMPWYGTVVEEVFGVGDIDLIINNIEGELIAGVAENETDDYFINLKSELDQQKVPLSIKETLAFEEVEALLDVSKIEPDYIKALGETYDASQKETIKNAIGLWQSENLNILLSGKTLSASYDDGSSKDIITILDIGLKSKEQELKNVYFVVALPSGVSYSEVEFAGDYDQESVDSAIGFRFKKIATAGETVSMAMPGKHDVLIINMFASSRFDELSMEKLPPVTCGNGACDKGEDYKNCPEDCKPTKRVITYILLVVIFGALGVFLIWRFYAAIYDLMQQKKLFKTKKNYTDLLIFISASLSRGITEKEIRDRLLISGWNEGQVEYAMLKATKARQKLKKEEEKKTAEESSQPE